MEVLRCTAGALRFYVEEINYLDDALKVLHFLQIVVINVTLRVLTDDGVQLIVYFLLY